VKEDEIGMGHRGTRFLSSGARRKFLLKKQTNGTSARRKGQATAECPAAKAGDQLSGRILTDRSDPQIAEDPESVSTAQGG